MVAVLVINETSKLCLTCHDEIFHGERAWLLAGAGAWHEDCDSPSQEELKALMDKNRLLTRLVEAKEEDAPWRVQQQDKTPSN